MAHYFTHLKPGWRQSYNRVMDKRAYSKKDFVYFLITRKKNEIRRRLLNPRLNLSPGDMDQKSREITKKIIAGGFFSKTVNKIAAYLPVKNEVNTSDIINFAIESEIEVYLPKYFANSNEYKLARFESWEGLETGPYGIAQPASDETVDANEVGLVFVPGVAFDKKGVRLGYGKGVYDRLFANSGATLVGLAYEFQVVGRLPRADHDLRMDLVGTEKRILRLT